MTTDSTTHDPNTCRYCYHEAEDGDPAGCWCPECIYGLDGYPPDDPEEAYREHVRRTGMAPPHADGSRCTCLFGSSSSQLSVTPGSRAESQYQEALTEYRALMSPVWDEVRTSDWTSEDLDDPDFFNEVLLFDIRMRTLTKTPPLINELGQGVRLSGRTRGDGEAKRGDRRD